MSLTFKILSAMLQYPSVELQAAVPAMRPALADEGLLSTAQRASLEPLLAMLGGNDLLETQEVYTDLFDRGRAHSLYLFEHVHGDSRDRGPAMIDLAQTYEKAGLFLAPGELPDYLPVVLEFASTQPPREARAFLGELAHILNALFTATQQRQSPYASVLGALLELAGEKAQAVKLAPEPALDESWAEPVVFDGCSVHGQAKPGQPQPIHFVRRNINPGVTP